MEINPYAPSAGRLEDASQTAEAERIRTTHINHEASILLVGLLYYLGGALAILGGVGALGNDLRDWRFGMAMPFILIGVGVAQIAVGRGVQTLKNWGRTATVVLSARACLHFLWAR